MGLKDKVVSLGRTGKQKQKEAEGADLRRLDRIQLMELIVDQRKRIEELESGLEEARGHLNARTIRIDVENVSDKRDLSRALRTALREVEGTFGTE